MVYALIVSAVLAVAPHEPMVTDAADVIELNHFFDERGTPVFDQVIFWRWYGERSRFHVIAWRLLKSPAQVPLRDRQRGRFVAIWLDGNVLRKVSSPTSRETWTQFDPELQDRLLLPQHNRHGLSGREPVTAPQGETLPHWP